jgi:hypothetical protein
MVMEVAAGLPAGLEALGWRGASNPAGNSAVVLGVNSVPTRAEHTRPTAGQPAQKGPNADGGGRRITRLVWESWT